MKKGKFLVFSALLLALVGMGKTSKVDASTLSTTPIAKYRYKYKTATVYDTIKPELRSLKTKYDSAKKTITISGLATKGKRVVVKYGNKKVKNVSIKNGTFATNIKFTGYKPFSLYAVDAKGKKVTPTAQLSSYKYAAKQPVVLKAERTTKGITATLSTKPNGSVSIYYLGKKISSKKTTSDKTKIFISSRELKSKKNYFTVKQFQRNKKAGQAAKIKINKLGIVTVVNY
ncbi:hypothetical protein J2Z60_001531 [Lactobacillus colini]|uniref:Uncharacterized protein n=1 Tax=Lactobacillus colini TaxID=1819254 RepID=A0ABS4MG67_9LACO|nr:zinc metalloproteinase [Lactobacillus colini]MBP2058352.1 hypothetical protein [Lactobacillus colini]